MVITPEIRLPKQLKTFWDDNFLSIDYELTMANWGLKISHPICATMPVTDVIRRLQLSVLIFTRQEKTRHLIQNLELSLTS